VLSRGDHLIFLEDPISLALLIAAAIFIAGSLGKTFYDWARPQPASR